MLDPASFRSTHHPRPFKAGFCTAATDPRGGSPVAAADIREQRALSERRAVRGPISSRRRKSRRVRSQQPILLLLRGGFQNEMDIQGWALLNAFLFHFRKAGAAELKVRMNTVVTPWEWKRLKGWVFSPPSVRMVLGGPKETRKPNPSNASLPDCLHIRPGTIQ